jgi:DNA-binding Lrp family transcriptional regulator/DNA-binding transcriptional ArsR family regulator
MIAERKYDNGERERQEGERKEKEARRSGRLSGRFGYCVKCGITFEATPTLLPATPDASPRWSKFAELVTCPYCGDDEGHAGILSAKSIDIVADGRDEHEPQREKPNPIALRAIDQTVREILDALSERPREETIRALIEHRGISEDFARWLTDKGVRLGTIDELRFKVSATTYSKIRPPKGFDLKAPAFFIPVCYHTTPQDQFFVGMQLRQIERDAKPKYVTVKWSETTPLTHFALPNGSWASNGRIKEVWLTEGIFKAEAIAYYRKAVAIGALGGIARRDAIEALIDAALWWQEDADLFTATVILAPDADYREKKEVAKATWKAKRLLERRGFRTLFAIWDSENKGIDDALEAGDEPVIVNEDVWLATLPRTIRDALLQVRTKTRVLLDRETAEALELQESETVTTKVEAEKYETERRKQYWLETIAELANKISGRCETVIIDTSPAGTGKTKAAASLRLKELRKAGILAKRLVYIAPEIKRPAVIELERFRLFVGRDAECVYYGRLKELEQEGLTHIGRRVCPHCPMRKLCGYYAQRQTGARYWRFSWQSYSPRDGDFVVLDEFSRLPIYRHIEVSRREFGELLRSVDRYGASPSLIAALKELRKWLDGKDRTNEEVKELFANVTTSAWDWFAHEIKTIHSDIRETREWVYEKRDERPKGFWWAEWLADIMRGLKVGQVWVEKGKLRIMSIDPKIKSLAKKAAAILILDATANPTEVWELFGMAVHPISSDDPEVSPTVIQVPIGALSHRANAKRKEEAHRIAKEVIKGLQRIGKLPKKAKIGVLTHKDAAEIALRVWGKHSVIGWWLRDERATNVFYDAKVTVLVTVGLPHRNIGTIAAEAGKAGYKLKALRKARLDREGNYWTIIKEFADKNLARAVRRETETAYKQAAGRLRQGRRSEQTFMVVLDTEPLPQELNPEVIPPEQVLPTELLQQYKAKQQRGLATVNELKRKIAAERLEKAIKAILTYRGWTGEEPDAGWIAKVIGTSRKQAWKIMKECDRLLAPESKPRKREKGMRRPKPDGEERQPAWWQIADRWERARECAKAGHTFALSESIPLSYLFISNVCPSLAHPHLAPAVAAFLLEGYPVPYRALARRFGVHPQQVKRLAAKMQKHMEEHGIKPKPLEERIEETYKALAKPVTVPQEQRNCPECSTELEPDELGRAVCVGCGRMFTWSDGRWLPTMRIENEARQQPP